MVLLSRIVFFIAISSIFFVESFVLKSNKAIKAYKQSHATLKMVDETVLSLFAGSVSGSIGVGVAYPLDTIKTKSQTYAATTTDGRSLGAVGMFKMVLKEEGLSGFYGGVLWVMLGQAFIKSAAFASNTWALNLISFDSANAGILELILAASFAGFATSFVVNPIERVKILMQADNTNQYENDLDCFFKVLKKDGLSGLVLRGIDATLWREVPGYALYFVAYYLLKTSILSTFLGPATPLVCGAMAGSFSWLPVYPFDVIKSNMQNTVGAKKGTEKSLSMLDTALSLYQLGGWGIFYDGITPKLIRASLNHAVTFYIYEAIMASGGAVGTH